jgi:hypothetical protein
MSTSYSNQSRGSNRTKIQSPENFLEALRGLGRSVSDEVVSQAKSVVTLDIPESFGAKTSGGTLKPNESFSLNDLKSAKETGYRQAENEFTQRLGEMRQMEYGRLVREESEAKKQIQSIREDIANLAKSMGEFSKEIEVASLQAPTNPGIYHKNFYAHLRSVIKALRAKVESSRDWLSTTNSRAKKRNFYWSQVKSSGTKFMLSSERYMVTSTG